MASTSSFDVTSTIDRKIAALRAHASQIKKPDELDAEIRSWAAEVGKEIGTAAGERLRVIVIDDDQDEAPETG